jgi:hypothetical protein
MVRTAVSAEAFEAIASTLPLGSVAVAPEPDAGANVTCVAPTVVNRLSAMRWPGETGGPLVGLGPSSIPSLGDGVCSARRG